MRLKSKFYPVVLVLLIFCVLSAFSQDGTEPILATDLLKLKVINQIDISPDGSKVVFVLSSMGKDDGGEYRYYRHLWLIDLEDPTSPIQLTYGDRDDSSSTWSPNGSQIAFVRQHKKGHRSGFCRFAEEKPIASRTLNSAHLILSGHRMVERSCFPR